ncbi:cupin [Devosia riboflavina]|uniref:Cupin n=1 Tax=Devosia riboflavina TaxID=46914 RepID=A0A087LZS8_9HYPH|nr:cupin domain-containing protein [Devosia riboflavina]KFL30131.1 cupin [Devosia riboflavina]
MQIIEQNEWATAPGLWNGIWEGGTHGAPITVIFHSSEGFGHGPKLHTHPYSETFIIEVGRALFVIGEEEFEAEAGQILVCPAGVPHKYTNLGPGLLKAVNIHANGTSVIDWLE